MQIRELITESLSKTVYHYTGLRPALDILRSGNFKLSSVLGSVEQQYSPPGKPYFLSTTRTRHGGYHSIVGSGGVLFKLNGDWFNRNYSSKPVDYWGNRSPQSGSHRSSEAEDRVFSRDPEIGIGGVEEVHVLVKDSADGAQRARARQILIQAKKLGIPAYLYNSEDAWRNLDKRQTGSISTLRGIENTRSHTSTHEGWLRPWIELISAVDKNSLSKKANEYRYNLAYANDYRLNDSARGLANDLSNARKPDSGIDRTNAVKIIDYMQRNGLKTVYELVKHLASKWQNT